ncbi:Uncharacterised protein [Vibrio cholerae]|nr:Uncharacterised protein [Vibrio cholerae]
MARFSACAGLPHSFRRGQRINRAVAGLSTPQHVMS